MDCTGRAAIVAAVRRLMESAPRMADLPKLLTFTALLLCSAAAPCEPARSAVPDAPPRRALALVDVKPVDLPLMVSLRQALDLAFARAGLSYTLETRPGERALAEFKAGQWDGDPNRTAAFGRVYPQAIRVQPHLYNANSFVVAPLQAPLPKSWAELKGKNVAILRGYKTLELNTSIAAAREITNSEESCLRMALAARVDYCVLRGDEAGKWPGEERFSAQMHASRIDQVPVHLWLGPAYADEARRLSEALRAMEKSGELRRVMGRFRLEN
jgi:ABC-type amino acid transport substrate-binding protein